jgi:hypothetical protein
MRKSLTSVPHRAFRVFVAAAFLNFATAAGYASAGPAPAPVPSGQLTVAGAVTLDGAAATTGGTFFSGSELTTAPGARALLSLGRLGRLELSEESALRLDFSDDGGFTGGLGAGGLRVYAPAGAPARVVTPDAAVEADAAISALFSVRFEGGETVVSVQSGRVELRAGGVARPVAAGETASSAGGAGQTSSQGSGKRRRRLAAGLGIAAALAVLIVVITGRDDEDEPPFDDCGPIILSGTGINPCA